MFRKFAVEMDDAIYGKKPAPAELPDWLEIYPADD